jgi:hypothetical protein
MTTEQKLKAIREKCVELLKLESAFGEDKAGWKATIAAIDGLRRIVSDEYEEHVCDNDGRGCPACTMVENVIKGIIAPWEGLV